MVYIRVAEKELKNLLETILLIVRSAKGYLSGNASDRFNISSLSISSQENTKILEMAYVTDEKSASGETLCRKLTLKYDYLQKNWAYIGVKDFVYSHFHVIEYGSQYDFNWLWGKEDVCSREWIDSDGLYSDEKDLANMITTEFHDIGLLSSKQSLDCLTKLAEKTSLGLRKS